MFEVLFVFQQQWYVTPSHEPHTHQVIILCFFTHSQSCSAGFCCLNILIIQFRT